MGDDKAKLTRALARLTALRKEAAKHRDQVQRHASARLDHARHCVAVASEHLQGHDNPLVYRYARTQMTEATRLAGAAVRSEGDRETSAEVSAGES